jgi:hypothetical protein
MGYFDALTNSGFKTAQDGTRLFFPWGTMGRGYRIASEQDYLRLRKQVKTYLAVSLFLIIVSGPAVGYPYALAIAVPLMAFYLAWMPFVLGKLQRSDERLSFQESMTSQAVAHNPKTLRFLQIASVAFVVIGAVMLLTGFGDQLSALVSIFFFGFCAIVFTRMIAVRQRVSTTQPTSE